jgi:hypothetical protein
VVKRAAWNSLEQGKQSGAVHGFHNDIFLVQQPRLLGVPATARRRCGGAEEEDWEARLDAGEAEQHDAVSSRPGSYSAVGT